MTHRLSIRIYTYRELVEMFRRAGFDTIEGFNTATGEPFKTGSPRLTMVATKRND
jgi:hypothetical protein